MAEPAERAERFEETTVEAEAPTRATRVGKGPRQRVIGDTPGAARARDWNLFSRVRQDRIWTAGGLFQEFTASLGKAGDSFVESNRAKGEALAVLSHGFWFERKEKVPVGDRKFTASAVGAAVRASGLITARRGEEGLIGDPDSKSRFKALGSQWLALAKWSATDGGRLVLGSEEERERFARAKGVTFLVGRDVQAPLFCATPVQALKEGIGWSDVLAGFTEMYRPPAGPTPLPKTKEEAAERVARSAKLRFRKTARGKVVSLTVAGDAGSATLAMVALGSKLRGWFTAEMKNKIIEALGPDFDPEHPPTAAPEGEKK